MATSPWYREGTAKFTQGSTTVTGTGTRWVDFVRAGDGIQGPDGKLYQVTNVASNTSISITPAYGSETTYWTIPIQGYVKRLADAASRLVRDFEGGADEALDAADRAKQSATEASVSEAAALSQANRAESEADRAETEADRAQQAADDAVAVVSGGEASIDPEPGKIPIAGAEGAIKQAWVHELEFALDKLRAATNKALYGDGPYPVLDFQFQGANMLDPRITFTRASKDWDSQGGEHEIDEPVLADEGLWVSKSRTNLFLQSIDLLKTPWRALGSIRKLPGLKSPIGTDVFSLDRDVVGSNYFYQPVTIEEGVDYTFSCLVQFKSGDEEYRLFMGSAAFDGGGSSIFTLGEDGGLMTTSNGKYKELGGGWFLVWRTGKGKENVTGNHIQFHAYPNDPLVDNFMSAPQFEAGVVPTAFIPTEGSQVTVARAEGEVPGSILTPSSVGGTFFASGIIPHYSDFNTLVGIRSSNSNELRIGYANTTGIGAVFKSGTTQRSVSIPVEAVGVGEVIKVAFSYSLSFNGEVEFRTCINGELQNVMILPALPVGFPNLGMAIGKRGVGSSSLYWNEKIFGVSYYDNPLSDEQLQELTTL